MAKNSMKPQIRFKGFTDAWEQRKLGDILQTLPFKQFLKEPEMDGKYEVIQQGGEPIIGFANGTPCTDYKDIVIFGDHTLSLYKPKQPFFVATDGVRILKGTKNVDGFFLLFLLERYKPQSEGYKRYFNILSDIECFMSYNISEQKKIGAFFDTLDNLITLHQRKYEKFVNMKKALLEKMFPQGDEKVPRIRFKGFTDAWEQRKLGDIAIEVNRTDANSNAPIMMITANDGFIEQSERYAFNNAGESLKRYIVLQKGELAYNHGASKLRPYGSCFSLINQEKARIPFVYHCFSVEKHNPEFVSIELNGNDVERQLRRIVSSGARMDGLLNISFQDYASISVLLPKKAEQDKIASAFRNLDNLTTLHQRQVEKLKNIKSALLEKMFV